MSTKWSLLGKRLRSPLQWVLLVPVPRTVLDDAATLRGPLPPPDETGLRPSGKTKGSPWTLPDLRNKLLFTLGLLLVYRILAHIMGALTHQEQVNLVNHFGSTRSQNLGQLLSLLDVFSGGSLQTFSLVALGLAPSITAAIVVWYQQNIAENLQKQGSFIPGYRPGEPTRKFLSAILNRITLGGALFLGIVAILPFVSRVGGNQLLSRAALLIVVGMVLDTVRQLDAHMIIRNYSGFLK